MLEHFLEIEDIWGDWISSYWAFDPPKSHITGNVQLQGCHCYYKLKLSPSLPIYHLEVSFIGD